MPAPSAESSILIIDHNSADQLCFREILESEGHRVFFEKRWPPSQRHDSEPRYDLVLLNIRHPEINSLDLQECLQSLGKTIPAPVIALLESSDIEKRGLAFAAGAADYILSPLQPDEVRSRVKKNLPSKRALARRQAPSDDHPGMHLTVPWIGDLFSVAPDGALEDIAPLSAQIHQHDLAVFLDARNTSIQDFSPLHCEFRIVAADQNKRWVELHALPCRKADGSIVWHGFIHDISERKHTENELALRSFALDCVREALYVVDYDFRIIHVNEEACRVLGYSRDELLTMKVFDIDPDLTWETIQEWSTSNLCVPDVNIVLHRRHRAKDGRVFPVEIFSSLVEFGGRPLSIALARDITERKRREREHTLLKEAVNASSEAAFLQDERGRFVYVNDAACRSLGYSRDELLAMTPFDIDPDLTPEHFDILNEHLFGGPGKGALESRHRTREGRIYPVELSATLVVLEGEKFCLVMARDISARRRTEDALRFIARNGKQPGNEESFLPALARYIGEALQVDYVFIDRLTEDPEIAETAAAFAKGEILPSMRYSLRGAPCAHVMGNTLCLYPAGIQSLFPEDKLLVDIGAESYAGIPLWDSDGRPIGLIAILDSKPLVDESAVTSLLQLVAIRTAAELERERHEQHLLAREREFRTLAENLPDNVMRWDCHGRIQYANPTLEDTIGVPVGDILGKCISNAFVDGRYDPIEAAVFQVAASGAPLRLARQSIAVANGDLRIHDITLVPERDATGQVASVVGIGRDMTELYGLQDALAAREAEFRTLTEHLPDNICRYDLDGRTLYVNPALEKTLGDTARHMLGTTIREYHAHGGFEEYARAVDRVRATGENVEIEFALPSPPGEPAAIHQIRVIAERNRAGQLTGALTIGRDITERKRMEQALAASEQQYRSLAENLPDNIVRYDEHGYIVYLNPVAARTQGKPLDEVLGRHFRHCQASQHFPEYAWTLESVLAGGAAAEFEITLPLPSGATAYHQIRMIPEHAADGRLTGVIAIGHDISERKRMVHALTAREREYRSLAENAPEAIIRYDREGRIRYLNAALMRWLGHAAPDELIGRHPREIWPDGRYAAIVDTAARVVETGKAMSVEIVAPDPGGTRYVDILVAPERDERGEIVGTIAFGRDVTHVREAELRFKHFIDNIPGFAYTFRVAPDGQASFPYVSPAVEELYGFKADEVMGKFAPIHECWHPEDRPRIEAATAESARTMKVARLEARLCRPGHPERWIDLRSVPTREPDGGILWYGIMLDITERKHMEEALAARERDYRSLAETSPDAIIRYDREGRIRYLNAVLIRWLGLATPDEVIGRHPREVWPDGRFAAIVETAAWVVETGKAMSVETIVPDPGGTRHHDILVAPERDERGEIVGTIAFGRDITHIREAERRLQHFVDSLPGFAYTFRLDPDGHASFPYASSGIHELYGLVPEDVCRDFRPIHDLAHPEDRIRIEAAIEESARSMTPFHIESRICRPGLPMRWQDVRSVPERQPDGSILWYGIMLDITERQQAEQERHDTLRLLEALDRINRIIQVTSQMEHMLSAVLEVAVDVFACDRAFLSLPCDPTATTWSPQVECNRPEYADRLAHGAIMAMDPELAEMQRLLLGTDRPLVFGPDADALRAVPSCLAARFGALSTLTMALRPRTGPAWQFGLHQFSHPRRWTSWDERLFQEIGRRVEDGLTSMLAHREVIEREEQLRQSNAQLRELTLRQETAREEERKRIAREIHDELGQNLTALRMGISQLRFQFGTDHPDLAEHIGEMHGLATASLKTVRSIASALRPAALDAGIGTALSWLAKEFQHHAGIPCQLTLPESEVALDEDQALPLFRITQESLTNIARHAQASKVAITLRREDGSYVIEIRDDGKGFDPTAVKARSFGLVGMRERAQMAGGRVDIRSRTGKGTTVRFRMPSLEEKESHDPLDDRR